MTPNAQALLASMRDNPDKHMRATIDNLKRKQQAGEYDSARAWFLVWNNVRDGAKRYAVTVDDKRSITTALLQHLESSMQCESGMQLHKSVFFDEPRASTKPIDPPSIVDVLYSLCSDSDVLEYASFAEWCSDFGYDTDSRKAKDIYDQCLSIALNMRGTLGDSVLSELRESFQDY